MSRKQFLPFFTFFNFSSDVYNKFHIELSHQYYPEDITHDDDDQLSTKPIRQKRLEIMKMMVLEDITHDDDQLSTKMTQDHEDVGIMEKESLFEDITYDNGQLSTKTTQDHEDDGIMETEEDFEEEESLFEDIECYILYFAGWCIMIYVSFRIQFGVLCFWIRLSKILHHSFFLRVL